jgi:hypothetical protein
MVTPIEQTPDPDPTQTHTALVRNVARLSGHPADGFVATSIHDGSVCVRSPNCVAFYSSDQWLEAFTRHLLAGYFDAKDRPRQQASWSVK